MTTAQQSFGDIKDLIDKICRATGESLTSDFARQQILDYLNMRYQMILSGKKWRFLREELYLDLTAPYETGTAVATQGSTTVTGTGTTWVSSMVGQKFYFPGDEAVYEIESVDSTTQITLKSNYTDETKSSTTSYSIIFDTYSRDENIDSINEAYIGGISGVGPTLQLVGLDHFREHQKNTNYRKGVPQKLTAYVETVLGDPNWTFEIYPAPDKAYTLLLEYDQSLTQLTDAADSYSLLPNKYQFVLFWAVVADVLADQKELQASTQATAKFQAAYAKLCSDYEMTDSRPRVRHEKPYFERARARSRFRHGRSGRQRIVET